MRFLILICLAFSLNAFADSPGQWGGDDGEWEKYEEYVWTDEDNDDWGNNQGDVTIINDNSVNIDIDINIYNNVTVYNNQPAPAFHNYGGKCAAQYVWAPTPMGWQQVWHLYVNNGYGWQHVTWGYMWSRNQARWDFKASGVCVNSKW